MKPFIKLLLLTAIILSYSVNAQQTKVNLTGNWILTDYWENETDFILSSDNYVSMLVNGEFIDGKNFVIHGGKDDGQKAELKYWIDYDKNPIEIDFIAIKDNTEKGRILGAIKPINENEFIIILSFEGSRDKNFSEDNLEKIMSARRKL